MERVRSCRERLRLPWNQLVPHRGMVREARHNNRIDFQLIREHVIERVHVEMPGSGPVVDPILNKLKAGKSGIIERPMIAAAVMVL